MPEKNYIVLKQNSDFRRAYGRGKSFSDPALVTYVLKNNRAGVCRMGITTSKKIGNAVERNRSRRIIRAAFRENLPNIKGGYDFIFVARTRTKSLKSTDVSKIMDKHLAKAGGKTNEKISHKMYPILSKAYFASSSAHVQVLSYLLPIRP